MNAAKKSAPNQPLRTALVVSAHEGHARVDRISLKNARIAMSRAVPSGREAITYLLDQGADVVLVDETLADGSGWDFMRALKSDPRLRHLPVIMLSSTVERERVVEAVRLGCVGYLVRPYTLDTFFKHLALARQSKCFLREELDGLADCLDMAEEGRVETALPKLEKVLSEADEAHHHYELGLRQLAREEYSQAVQSFGKAARLSALQADAHLGLARCWLALGDEVRYRKALTQAADACAKAERFEHYKDEFLSIIADDARAFNPFLSLGMRLSREMDRDGALMALKNAVWLCPNDAKAHLELGKAWHFKREPELAKRSVAQALMLSSHDHEANALYERFTGRTWEDEAETVEEKPVYERRQIIPDMVPAMLNGVLYLAGMVTEGIHRFRRDYA